MLGIIVYIYFLALGFLYADKLFKDRDVYFKAWSGGVIGNVILMMGIVPFACIFKFSYVSHISRMSITVGKMTLGGYIRPQAMK